MITQPTETEIIQQIDQIKQTLRSLDRESEHLLTARRQREISEQQRSLNDTWEKLNRLHYSLYGDW